MKKNTTKRLEKHTFQRARDPQTGTFLSIEKQVTMCEWCSKSFVPKSIHTRFCSRNCLNNYRHHKADIDRISKKCKTCGNNFYVTPSSKDRPFCSAKCYFDWQRRDQRYIACLNCGKRILATPSRGNTFCSNECYRAFSNLVSWNKDKIIQAITALRQSSSDLTAAYIRDTNRKLFKAAINHFGSWEEAVSGCGIQYEHIRSDRKGASYKGLILQDIVKALYKEAKIHVKEKPYLKFEKEACIPDFVEVDENKWIDVKLHSFSSGIDKTIRKYSKYTNDLIILYLLGPSREEDVTNVHFINIHDYFSSMYKDNECNSKIRKKLDAIERHYVSYPWQLKQMARKWSKKKVTLKIRELYKHQVDLNGLSAKKSIGVLRASAAKYFDSWEEAVTSSGFNYKTDFIKRKPKWTSDEILKSIKQLDESGADLNYDSLTKNGKHQLYHAGCRVFGDWSIALSEAGVDLEKVKRSAIKLRWSKDNILSQIKHLNEINQSLAPSDIKKSNNALFRAANRRFGTWRSALETAELDYAKILKRKFWSKEKVLKEIESLRGSGIALSYQTLKAKGRVTLYHAARSCFGSWKECLRIAGLKPSPISRKRKRDF